MRQSAPRYGGASTPVQDARLGGGGDSLKRGGREMRSRTAAVKGPPSKGWAKTGGLGGSGWAADYPKVARGDHDGCPGSGSAELPEAPAVRVSRSPAAVIGLLPERVRLSRRLLEDEEFRSHRVGARAVGVDRGKDADRLHGRALKSARTSAAVRARL